MVRDRLAEHDWNYGFIIDGFPRNARQAEFFLESYDIDGVINLDLPDEEVTQPGPGPPAVLASAGSTTTSSPTAPSGRTPATSAAGPLVARDDDNPEALAIRLADVPRGDQAADRDLRAQGVRGHHRRHQAGGRGAGRHPPALRTPARHRLTAHPARSGGRRPAYSTWALIRSRVVRMPLRLVRPRAHPRTAQ